MSMDHLQAGIRDRLKQKLKNKLREKTEPWLGGPSAAGGAEGAGGVAEGDAGSRRRPPRETWGPGIAGADVIRFQSGDPVRIRAGASAVCTRKYTELEDGWVTFPDGTFGVVTGHTGTFAHSVMGSVQYLMVFIPHDLPAVADAAAKIPLVGGEEATYGFLERDVQNLTPERNRVASWVDSEAEWEAEEWATTVSVEEVG